MVEETYTCECHGYAILVAGLDHIVIAHRTARLGNKLYAALVRTLYVVAEGEESIAAQCHLGILGYPFLLLFAGEHLWLLLEKHLPCAFAQYIIIVVADIHVDSIVAVGTAYAINKWKVHDFRMLAQPPYICLVASQACAVNTALLTSTDANGLTILDIANGITLGILEGYKRDDKVALGLVAECLVGGGDIIEEGGIVKAYLIAALLKGYSKHLLALYWVGHIVRVYLYHIICALALGLEYIESLRGIVGGNHSVAYLTFD